MQWFGFGRTSPHEQARDERARQQLMEQEQRVQALDRMVEVIQRDLGEDRPHAAE